MKQLFISSISARSGTECSLADGINFLACALVNSTEHSYVPYLEPGPVSFLEHMIYFWVIKSYADLILMDMETQPCRTQAYRERESDVADALKISQAKQQNVCVCIYIHVKYFFSVYIHIHIRKLIS